jgi:hypothetical protein
MELSQYVETLRRELGSLTRFASDDIVRVADMLAEALDSSVRLTLLDVLSAAAAEITARLDEVVIDVRLSAGEPQFVVTVVPAAEPEPAGPSPDSPADDAGTARITLRLSESLKARVESEASAAGLSVNAWLAHAAIRAIENPASSSAARSRAGLDQRLTGLGQRLTGYARS